MKPFCVALTGGIGVGKSTTAKMFEVKGAQVVNVDQVGHFILGAGRKEYRQIVDLFGETVLTPGKDIDRSALGRMVFESPNKLIELEAITHPAINRELRKVMTQTTAEIVILDMAILVEKPLAQLSGVPLYKKVIVVKCSTDIRIQRLFARGMTREEIMSRIESQASDEERDNVADLRIDNSSSLNNLQQSADRAWEAVVSWAEQVI